MSVNADSTQYKSYEVVLAVWTTSLGRSSSNFWVWFLAGQGKLGGKVCPAVSQTTRHVNLFSMKGIMNWSFHIPWPVVMHMVRIHR
jgi:hypothetical protein